MPDDRAKPIIDDDRARPREHLDVAPGAPIAILDVAAGPLTCIGKKWDNHSIRIDPVDILAPLDKQSLAKHQIIPLIETKYATIGTETGRS